MLKESRSRLPQEAIASSWLRNEPEDRKFYHVIFCPPRVLNHCLVVGLLYRPLSNLKFQGTS